MDDPAWQRYLTKLAEDADARRDELGRQVTEQQPQWAIEALGPVPDDEQQRAKWREQAGVVAAHRELTSHDDPATAIGAPPKAGQVEAYASWRAAWHALGRPEADRDEAEMSDGQLLVRIRAYQREQTWAPPYVANELAGTRQAADRHRATAILSTTAAAASTDDAERAQLERRAAESDALARVLDQRAAQLVEADEGRARWYAHTAVTRAAADRAQLELAARRAGENRADDQVNATERESSPTAARGDHVTDVIHRSSGSGRFDTDQADEAAHDRLDTAKQAVTPDRRRGHHADEGGRADRAERSGADKATDQAETGRTGTAQLRSDDQHRGITDDADFADVASQREADRRAIDDRPHPDAAETAVRDIRDVSAEERSRDREDQVRVPSAEETADAIRRAHRALAEIHARDWADARKAAEEARTEQLARWHHEKHEAADERTQNHSDGRGV